MRTSLLMLLVLAGCASEGLPVSDPIDAGGRRDLAMADLVYRCGDPATLARYPSCLKATDEKSCTSAGGKWTIVGLSLNKSCLCPTGQESCSCSKASDCLAGCIGEVNGGPTGACDRPPSCARYNMTAGCFCHYDEGGVGNAICVD